ncbi:MAG: hypothetical protein HKN22_00710, partial [Bacteroidia bacterium]|nr:hypothetical protein [Bacteroidia bacterium]
MKLILTLIFSIVLSNLSAQISIDKRDMPGSGDVVEYSEVSPLANLDLISTGTDHLWDFSYLNSSGSGTYQYKSAGSINFAYSLFFGFSSFGLLTFDT